MSVTDGLRANASNFNSAFLSRLTNSDTVAIVDFLNGSPASGASVYNIQRAVNSVCSTLGIANSEAYDYLITWAADYVGAPNDAVKVRIEALVSLFDGSTGHTHSGTDGQGPKLSTESISIIQANDSTLGNIDTLDSDQADTIRLTGVGSVTLRGISNGVAGRRRVLMNLTGQELTILNNDSNPAAIDKIITGDGGDLTLQDGAAAFIEYDGTSNVWRVISGSGGGGIFVSGSFTSPVQIAAVSGFSVNASKTSQTVFAEGDGGPVNITAVPQISAGSKPGQKLTIYFCDNTNTIQIDDGDGVSLLNGSSFLGVAGSYLILMWRDDGVWSEIGRG